MSLMMSYFLGGFGTAVVILLYAVLRTIEKFHVTVQQLAYDLEKERKKIIERRNY